MLLQISLLLLTLAPAVQAIIGTGYINSTSPVAVLGKFCYRATKDLPGDESGKVAFTISYPPSYQNLKMLLFFQNLEDWNEIVASTTTCSEYIELAGEKGNVFSIGPGAVDGELFFDGYKQDSIVVPFSTTFNRFFFFMLSNCEECDNPETDECLGDGPLKDIWFFYEASNPYLAPFDQISYDELLAPPIAFVGLTITFAYTVLQSISSIKMFRAGKFHHTVTLLQISCLLQFFGFLAMTILYIELMCEDCEDEQMSKSVYIPLVFPAVTLGLPAALVVALTVGIPSKRNLFSILLIGLCVWCVVLIPMSRVELSNIIDGSCAIIVNRPLTTLGLLYYPADASDDNRFDFSQYVELFRLVGSLCFRLSDWMFLMLLIVMAKGWTIVRRSLKANTQMNIAVFMTVYMAAIVFAVIMEAEAASTTQLVHFWQTGPGVLVLVLQILYYFWFIHSTTHTMARFKKQKRGFYMKFFVLFSGWVLVTPTLVLILAQVVSITALRSTLFITEHGITVFAQLAMVIMYIPDQKCNKGFPFHAMISQMKADPHNNFSKASVAGASAPGPSGNEATMRKELTHHDSVGPEHEKEERAAKAAVTIDTRGRRKFLVQSSVLMANPLTRCRVKLDAVEFRIHRLKMSVDSTCALLDAIHNKAVAKKSNRRAAKKRAVDDDESPASDILAQLDNGPPTVGPVVSSASRAAQRFKQANKSHGEELSRTQASSSVNTNTPAAPEENAFKTMELKHND